MTGKDIFEELGGIDPEMVLDAAPTQRIQFPRRIAAIAASLAVIFCLLWGIGFENVYAGVRELFSFIPGVGIREEQGAVYAWEPATGRLENEGMTAQILQACYMDGMLSVTVEVDGMALWGEDFSFYVNGAAQPLHDGDSFFYSLATASDGSMLAFDIPMEAPKEQDLFEIEIRGFHGRLAFTLTPCKTYEQLQEIGPTVTKNGISLTATANRFGNELVVWCYDTRWNSATQDTLMGIGQPINSAYDLLRYIETESGHIQDVGSGWRLRNRMVFQLQEGDKTAVLHVPYLAMYRQEKARATLRLPDTKSTPNIAIETSLGTIRVESMERFPEGENKDRIRILLAYDNQSEQERMYSIGYQISGGLTDYFSVTTSDGTMQELNVIVDKNAASIKLQISGIYYYLMEEYVIPLEIIGE